MPTVRVKEARQKFAQLVETARKGTPVTITRRGKSVARMTGIEPKKRGGLPDLTAFRASLPRGGKRKAATTADLRRSERA